VNLLLLVGLTGAFSLLLSIGLTARAEGHSICLTLHGGAGVIRYLTRVGDNVNLSFYHSIYGSEVDEQLLIGPKGFRTVKVRYSELRLAEFYGHEAAKFEEGWWVVEPRSREIPTLNLTVSQDSSIRITFRDHTIWLRHDAEHGGAFRLAPSSCQKDP
jgi:hypothetical protein